MVIDFLLQVFRENRGKEAIVWRSKVYDYAWLENRVAHWRKILEARHIRRGIVAILEADFSPDSVALFLALTGHECILVPLTKSVEAQKDEFIKVAQGEFLFSIDADDEVCVRPLDGKANHEFYQRLRATGHPGLVLFSSGSTGKSKAAVHDLSALLDKFKTRRHSLRTITFLLYDHIGGVNTMLHTLSNAGCIITVQDRSPDGVLAAVAKHRVELLPTSPTFVNLILISEAWKRHDLKSLKTVTYGTEPMSETTLKRFHQLFPDIQLLQTYGLSEVGILRSKSKSSDSLWMKIGGEGFETRVVNGVLQIKARSAMLGYLNAASPFAADGWFNTGDAVVVEGEYVRILGRESEIINVGGEKVYPAEVESCLQGMPNIAEVTIYGEKNPITGHIVCARFRLQRPEPLADFKKRVRLFCKDRLAMFKIPIKVTLSDNEQFSGRFKKLRHRAEDGVSSAPVEQKAGRLAVFGVAPAFNELLHVGRPNIGDRQHFLDLVNGMLDRRWLTNDGPLVKEFEQRVATLVGVRHCIAMCNATVALESAIRALELRGEVVVPSYTFIATAHALQWQEITPVFADMDPVTHTISPASIERLITPRTTGIVGVHVWGRACDTDAIEAIGRKHRLKVMYDAAHAFGCSRQGRMIGGFGSCEVFSFHATKFLNTFEGGAVVTNDDRLAERLRLMRNFGFAGYDHVVYLGVNGKMTEVCAAMGLTSLDAIDDLIDLNRRNYEAYCEELRGLPGLSVIRYDPAERNNYHYIVVEVDPDAAALNRDELVAVLHAENVLARKYFWPGCHRMEPYCSLQPNAHLLLPETERIASRILLLPTGQAVDRSTIKTISEIIRTALNQSPAVRTALGKRA